MENKDLQNENDTIKFKVLRNNKEIITIWWVKIYFFLNLGVTNKWKEKSNLWTANTHLNEWKTN